MIAKIVLALGVVALPVSAQQDSILLDAVRIATEGRADSALKIVNTALATTETRDARYPEILFTGGVVSIDIDSARAYFRRVSIEFSNSDWADESLMRLAQLSYAGRDNEAAARTAERILTDYPFSDIRADAAFLLARTHIDQRRPQEGCRYLRVAEQESGDDIELANRVSYYLQRCGAVTTDTDTEQRVTLSGETTFTVQVAAVQSAVAADELMRGLQREGYDALIVREDGFLKVRVGRFQQRSEAQELAALLRQRVGGQPFVVETR